MWHSILVAALLWLTIVVGGAGLLIGTLRYQQHRRNRYTQRGY